MNRLKISYLGEDLTEAELLEAEKLFTDFMKSTGRIPADIKVTQGVSAYDEALQANPELQRRIQARTPKR